MLRFAKSLNKQVNKTFFSLLFDHLFLDIYFFHLDSVYNSHPTGSGRLSYLLEFMRKNCLFYSLSQRWQTFVARLDLNWQTRLCQEWPCLFQPDKSNKLKFGYYVDHVSVKYYSLVGYYVDPEFLSMLDGCISTLLIIFHFSTHSSDFAHLPTGHVRYLKTETMVVASGETFCFLPAGNRIDPT